MAATTADDRRTAQDRYTRVAITLHWVIAAAIAYNLTSGLLVDVLPRWFFVFHISSGLTILALSIVRVGWRLTHKPPPVLPMHGWEKALAHVVHFLLYAAILFVPFSGWVMISANPPAGSAGAAYADGLRAEREPAPVQALPGHPTTPSPAAKRRSPPMFWGLVPIPFVAPVSELGREPSGVPEQRAFHEKMAGIHSLGGWVMLGLLFLHIAGALKHQYIDRQPELARMGVGRRARG